MEAHAGDAVLIQRLRGDFHRHLAHAGGAQLRKFAMHRDRVGRGERGVAPGEPMRPQPMVPM